MITEEIKYFSLFEFNGNKPVGKDKGGEIYAKAKREKIPLKTQEIKSKNYQGKIMMYPEYWLKKNFIIDPLPF